MIITYSEKDHVIDIAFHIDTRPDISAFFIILLTKFNEIKNINIMEVYMKNEDGQVLTGDKCIERHQINVKSDIIDVFIGDQVQVHYLQTSHVGKIC